MLVKGATCGYIINYINSYVRFAQILHGCSTGISYDIPCASEVILNDIGKISFDSLWHSNAIWRHRSVSTFAQVMACCQTAPSITWTNTDYSSVKSCAIHLRAISLEILNILYTWVWKLLIWITSASPGGQWVKLQTYIKHKVWFCFPVSQCLTNCFVRWIFHSFMHTTPWISHSCQSKQLLLLVEEENK